MHQTARRVMALAATIPLVLLSFQPTIGKASDRSLPADPEWQLSTDRFTDRFDGEPYVGNGYLGQRIPAAGMGFRTDGVVGWPLLTPRATTSMAAGLYARTKASRLFPNADKQVIATIPTWTTLSFSTPSGSYGPATATAANVADYQQTLDLRTGTVTTSGTWTSPGGQRAGFRYTIFTDRAHPHIGVVTLELTPQWSGAATVTSLLDGAGADRLLPGDAGMHAHTAHVLSTTMGTGVPVAEVAVLRYPGVAAATDRAVGLDVPQTAGEDISFPVQAGRTYTFDKFVAVRTGHDSAHPLADATLEALGASAAGTSPLAVENAAAWAALWAGGITVSDPDMRQAIRAGEYQLYASIRADGGHAPGPAGLSGDSYAGLVFWDSDTWMFPALLATHPDLAKVLVDYRFDTLDAARRNAAANGYRGAYYAWSGGDDGTFDGDCYDTATAADRIIDRTQGSCAEEVHLQADIALAQWQYFQATGDLAWLRSRGWPVIEAIAEFWVSRAQPTAPGAYSIDSVQPPDESHTSVDDSAYTNYAASLALRDAVTAATTLGYQPPAIWRTIADGLVATVGSDPATGTLLEYRGYHGEQIKQADVVMLTYPLNAAIPRNTALADLDYYASRTNDSGPAMTDAIHAIDAATLGAPGCSAYTYLLRAYQPYLRPPFDQFAESRARKPISAFEAFNFLTGIGGLLQVFDYGFTGLRFDTGAIRLDPALPPQLHDLTITGLHWQGRTFSLTLGPQTTTITTTSALPLIADIRGTTYTALPGLPVRVPTRRPDRQTDGDVAQCQDATASSAAPGEPATAAVDGSATTAWTATEPKATLIVHFSTPTTITLVEVIRAKKGPFDYTVDLSDDGTHWRTEATWVGPSAGVDRFRIGPTTASYLRLDFPGQFGMMPPSIAALTAR